jgi:PPOX class probable F420-dependent enzyme
MNEREAWERLRPARVGHLATVNPDGSPHVVPFVFAVADHTIYWAVDAKPKRARQLKRLSNIRSNPHVEMVVDGYGEDWRSLWWIRARGVARILEPGNEWDRALTLLAEKYEQYETGPPPGPVVAIDVTHVVDWEASAGNG